MSSASGIDLSNLTDHALYTILEKSLSLNVLCTNKKSLKSQCFEDLGLLRIFRLNVKSEYEKTQQIMKFPHVFLSAAVFYCHHWPR